MILNYGNIRRGAYWRQNFSGGSPAGCFAKNNIDRIFLQAGMTVRVVCPVLGIVAGFLAYFQML
jgi:hypothetical protein